MDTKELAASKPYESMYVTLLGMVTDVTVVHCQKAWRPMYVTTFESNVM